MNENKPEKGSVMQSSATPFIF